MTTESSQKRKFLGIISRIPFRFQLAEYGANLRNGYLEPAFAHLSLTRSTVACAIVSFCFIVGMLAAIDSAELAICRKCHHCGCLQFRARLQVQIIWRNSMLDLHLPFCYNLRDDRIEYGGVPGSWIVKLASFLSADWAVKRNLLGFIT